MSVSRAAACGAAGLLITLAACSSGAPKNGPVPHSSSAGAEPVASAQLTVAQAYSAFTEFLPQFSDLPAHPADIGRLTTGPELGVITASNGSVGPSVGDVSNTRILVPKLTGYPRWFIAAGTNSGGEGVLFVLVQHAAGAPWQETAELYDLGQAQIVPDLAAAGFGVTATTPAVPGPGPALAMQPAQLPAAYAQYLNGKGKGAQRGAFKAGTDTTGLIRLERTAAASAPSAGWKYTDSQSGAGLPQYALRLPGGNGAVVIFFTLDTATWTASSAKARVPAAQYSGLAEPPLQILRALGVTSVHAGLRVSVEAVDENLAIIGPAGAKGVTIAANAGRTFKLDKN
jgi:hypothetical protein